MQVIEFFRNFQEMESWGRPGTYNLQQFIGYFLTG